MNKIIYLILTIVLTTSTTFSFGRPSIQFSCPIDEQDPNRKRFENLYRLAFDALDIDFSMSVVSAQRSSFSASSGLTDGECARIENYLSSKNTDTLIRVEAPIGTAYMQAWSRSPNIHRQEKKELPSPVSRVGYRRGISWSENYLQAYPHIKQFKLDSTSTGIKMLAAGRIDLYIGERTQIESAINHLHLRNPIYFVDNLASLLLYPYLHVKHKHLVKPLAQQLRRILQEYNRSQNIQQKRNANRELAH